MDHATRHTHQTQTKTHDFYVADLKSPEQGAQLLLQIASAYTNGVKVSRIVDGEFEMGVMGDARDE